MHIADGVAIMAIPPDDSEPDRAGGDQAAAGGEAGEMSMLPQECIDTYRRLFHVEEQKLDARMQVQLGEGVATLSRNGMLNSSVALNLMVGTAAATLPVRAQTAFNLLLRCAGSFGIFIDGDAKKQAISLLEVDLRVAANHLRALVQATPPFSGSASGHIGDISSVLRRIDEDLAIELERLDGELTLLVAAAAQQKVTAQPAGPIFHGPVGLVQTGPGSYGVAHVNIDSGSRDELSTALSKLALALNAENSAMPFDLSDVREMITTGQSELAKPKPNGTMLRSIVTGIGGAISFAPKLKDAYDSLKWAAKLAGIDLP